MLEQFQFRIPDVDCRRRFSDCARDERLARSVACCTTDELAALRDLLLPKLVTGQIDVSHLDLDALVEAAVA